MCSIAQQCAVEKCIGSVVVQNRPLCNIGLTLKNILDLLLSSVQMAWLQITETLELRLSQVILPPSQWDTISKQLAWIDDGFFGQVCSAKVRDSCFLSLFFYYYFAGIFVCVLRYLLQ